jgi:hypothetical protein
MAKKDQFRKQIAIKLYPDDGAAGELVVGVPGRPEDIDADDGDRLGIYELKRVVTYRKHPQLEE